MSGLSAELRDRIRRVRFLVFDFDGVFTDNRVYVSEAGTESVACWRGDGLGLAKLRKRSVPMYVISTEVNPVVGARCRKLQLDYVQGCDDKLQTLVQLLSERGLGLEQAAFMGNDINDLDCLRSVGLALAVRDAHPDILGDVDYVTRAEGGRGAVREVCDLFDTVLARPGHGPTD